MPVSLEGKVVIVAGAGGIGDELARRYCAAGAAVVLGDLDQDRAESVAKSVSKSARAIGIRLDGADDDSIRSAVETAVSNFGGLDGFHVNYASFADGVREEDVLGLPLEVFDDVWRVNARGALLCTRHAIPAMLTRGGGTMLYTSSAAAYIGETARVSYAMSKLAVHALMRHVARRFGPDGIRANVIAPGVISHPHFEALVPPEVAASFMEATLLKTRLGTPSDIAAMSELLMSNDGSYVTGQVINIDGGCTTRA